MSGMGGGTDLYVPLLLYILESNLPMISTPLLAFIGVSPPSHQSCATGQKSV